jgi:hypothetical protein
MLPQTHILLMRRRYGLRWSAVIMLASVLLLGLVPSDSKAKVAAAPVDTPPFNSRSVAQVASPASTFAPFLNIVPSGDGTGLFIQAGSGAELGGRIVANVEIGPGGNKGSYTMTYSDTVQSYFATAVGFSPNTSQDGNINITTTLGLDSGTVNYVRAYVPTGVSQSINSQDGNLQLTFVNPDTIAFNTYIAIVPSFAPPGPAPRGHHFVGGVYSVRAADALVQTNKPMSLHLSYHDVTLGEVDPHTLAIFAWDAFNKRWDNLGGRLSSTATQPYLSVATSRFTTYALMATPAWRDDFNDVIGLEPNNDVMTLAGKLVLSNTLNAAAVSLPITPTTDFGSWGTLIFTSTTEPPTTTLRVDVLSLDGMPLLTSAVSGASLEEIDPVQYPSLRLRARLSSTTVENTPALDVWQITWEIRSYRTYLPILMR